MMVVSNGLFLVLLEWKLNLLHKDGDAECKFPRCSLMPHLISHGVWYRFSIGFTLDVYFKIVSESASFFIYVPCFFFTMIAFCGPVSWGTVAKVTEIKFSRYGPTPPSFCSALNPYLSWGSTPVLNYALRWMVLLSVGRKSGIPFSACTKLGFSGASLMSRFFPRDFPPAFGNQLLVILYGGVSGTFLYLMLSSFFLTEFLVLALVLFADMVLIGFSNNIL